MTAGYCLTLSDGERLNITTYGANTRDSRGTIVYVHGFKGFKDWGFVPYLGEYLSKKSFFVITFNFSHNGIGTEMTEFTELDKFAANTFSREVRELSELIDAYDSGFFGENQSPLGILGHSRGGGISLLAGRFRQKIKAIATWSSVATLARYNDMVAKKWRQDGFYEVVNQRTGQIMRLNLGLLEDIKKNQEDRLNIEKAVRSSDKPLLIIHGEDDDGVPVEEAQRIYSWADDKRSELFILPGTGHTFGAKHPFEGSNPDLEKVLEKTSEFFQKMP